MVRFSWLVWLCLVILSVCTSAVFLIARRKGYFFSPHSLRLRAFLGLVQQTPFRLFVDLISRVRHVEMIVTRFRGVVRAIVYALSGIALWIICITQFPWTAGTVTENNLVSHIGTAWQVHATITGFSVVALVFVWETLEANVQESKLVGEMTETQGLLDRIYFLIISNLFIGVGLFMSSPLSSSSTQTNISNKLHMLGLFSVVFVTVFLIVSAWELLRYYEDIHTLLFRKGPDEAAVDVYQQQLENEEEPDPTPTYREIVEGKLGVELSPYMSYLPYRWQSEGVRVSAEEIGVAGKEITDINLSELRSIMEIINEDGDVSLWYRLGDRPRESTSILRAEANISEEERDELVEQLRKSYKFKP